MTILIKSVLWFGKPATIVCDGNCEKAWGINNRPSRQLSENPDDYESFTDDELGIAPDDPGTYEGECGKPTDYADPDRQNKWCARECERGSVMQSGVVQLTDFSVRWRNIPEASPPRIDHRDTP